MTTLADVRHREMEILLALRTSNESKFLSAEDCCALSACVCQKAPSGAMVQCELCREIFHSGCVETTTGLEYGQAWLCPHCLRSRKPPLDKVLPLLASLQRIRVRLPEGDALRFLIERTVRWQHRVQQACAEGVLEKVSKTVSAYNLSYISTLICFFDAVTHRSRLGLLYRFVSFTLLFIITGECWTPDIITSDSGSKWFIILYRAPICSTPGSVLNPNTF